MSENNELMKLENQLCFLLYACARATTRYYRPFMDKMGLTYTQYLTMLVLWEVGTINVKRLGERLYLDSGTLTPVLKRLEEKGLVTRERSTADERNLDITITENGRELKQQIEATDQEMESWKPLSEEDCAVMGQLFGVALKNLCERMEDGESD